MKYSIVPCDKIRVDVILRFEKDLAACIANEGRKLEKIVYKKDAIIGEGVAHIELIYDYQDKKVKHYLVFESFQLDSGVKEQHISLNTSILNSMKIGLHKDVCSEAGIMYEIKGKIVDISKDDRPVVDFTYQLLDKYKQYIENKRYPKKVEINKMEDDIQKPDKKTKQTSANKDITI